LFVVHPHPWNADIVNYLVAGRIPEGWTKNDKDRFFHLVKFFVWDDPYLFSTVLTKFLGGAFSIMR